MIPKECGSADMYEVTAIMYDEEGSNEPEVEYRVFITDKDYADNKPFASIKANIQPTLLLYPDDEHLEIGYFIYDLVDAEFIHEKDNVSAIVVSEVVNASDTVWKNSETDRTSYLEIRPKFVIDEGNKITIEEF